MSTNASTATAPGPGRHNKAPTTIEDWTRSDNYHNSFLIPHDKTLDDARAKSVEKGLPDIAVSVAQGKFLKLLAQSIGARRILEVGTLGGYSTIWLARALPEDGELLTCELKPEHAQVAQENLENAGVASKVKIVVGPAKETLSNLQPSPPFDFIFVDADKPNMLPYYIEAKRLARKGGVIVLDNVVRNGLVSLLSHNDPNSEGVRTLLEYMKDDKEVDATTLGTVGEKGYDGFTYAVKL